VIRPSVILAGGDTERNFRLMTRLGDYPKRIGEAAQFDAAALNAESRPKPSGRDLDGPIFTQLA